MQFFKWNLFYDNISRFTCSTDRGNTAVGSGLHRVLLVESLAVCVVLCWNDNRCAVRTCISSKPIELSVQSTYHFFIIHLRAHPPIPVNLRPP